MVRDSTQFSLHHAIGTVKQHVVLREPRADDRRPQPEDSGALRSPRERLLASSKVEHAFGKHLSGGWCHPVVLQSLVQLHACAESFFVRHCSPRDVHRTVKRFVCLAALR